jgi:hypothetical protein
MSSPFVDPNDGATGAFNNFAQNSMDKALHLKMQNAIIEKQAAENQRIEQEKFSREQMLSPDYVNSINKFVGDQFGVKQPIFSVGMNEAERKGAESLVGMLASKQKQELKNQSGGNKFQFRNVGNQVIATRHSGYDENGEPTFEVKPLGITPQAHKAYADFDKESTSILTSLDQIEAGAKKLLSNNGLLGRIGNAASIKWQSLSGNASPEVVNFHRNLTKTALELAKVANGGRPTDKDQLAIEKAMPQNWDTLDTALSSVKSLREIIQRGKKTYYNSMINGEIKDPNKDDKPDYNAKYQAWKASRGSK